MLPRGDDQGTTRGTNEVRKKKRSADVGSAGDPNVVWGTAAVCAARAYAEYARHRIMRGVHMTERTLFTQQTGRATTCATSVT